MYQTSDSPSIIPSKNIPPSLSFPTSDTFPSVIPNKRQPSPLSFPASDSEGRESKKSPPLSSRGATATWRSLTMNKIASLTLAMTGWKGGYFVSLLVLFPASDTFPSVIPGERHFLLCHSRRATLFPLSFPASDSEGRESKKPILHHSR